MPSYAPDYSDVANGSIVKWSKNKNELAALQTTAQTIVDWTMYGKKPEPSKKQVKLWKGMLND